ncbi:putative glycoside hydrolase [Oceanobacillus bengalensis]|uniref:GTP-binding protein n=1 Tax=Oceanobacillus bengalensis TaxID=1435466 RepID=A0A494YVC2_9BACI|nr:putative glycoside hydrolase [Oceanobacillus bengalensis]RKQ14149.1 GTP-binding protein [Oceanobacillus bengalensis]
MGNLQRKIFIYMVVFLSCLALPIFSKAEDIYNANAHTERKTNITLFDTEKLLERFSFHSGYTFDYPDAVRGIYVTGTSAGSNRFNALLDLVETTDLNAMVIDVKDDHGNLTFKPEEGSKYESIAKNHITDPKAMMQTLEEKGIYPIARVVVFKDTQLANRRPDLSYTENGKVWVNGRGEAFVNPFLKEVWDYNVEIAKMAAEMGFQEIQFDYVRFPEGFEKKDKTLKYSMGDYEKLDMNSVKKRVEAVTDFVAYAKQELEHYDIDVAVDIFGYAATIEEAPGIGQNFAKISENVDVISSMIYPSHWSKNYFGIDIPDEEPYRLVSEYAKVENDVLGALDNPPVSRPWLQDFEAPWIYEGGPVKQYGKEEVEAQIKALYENGINEYLLWNAGNYYSENVEYRLGMK